ncbi:hypothetical protein F5Y14DRAFT_150198 [Nemania sp. NC0429]|nr:hypothetical protein F5Y14DRAFT_150198 [Nemania sp. NC0429]
MVFVRFYLLHVVMARRLGEKRNPDVTNVRHFLKSAATCFSCVSASGVAYRGFIFASKVGRCTQVGTVSICLPSLMYLKSCRRHWDFIFVFCSVGGTERGNQMLRCCHGTPLIGRDRKREKGEKQLARGSRMIVGTHSLHIAISTGISYIVPVLLFLMG